MFTGIIKTKGRVSSTVTSKGIKKLSFVSDLDLHPGESILIDGICSTIVSKKDKEFFVQYINQTLRVTTANDFKAGDYINLEQSLKVGEPIDGHFVYGHVDTVGVLKEMKRDGESKVFYITVPTKFQQYIADKGSVALDGVSLTISEKNKDGFAVSLIPYTLKETTLGDKKTGDLFNVEFDMIAKYLENLNAKKK